MNWIEIIGTVTTVLAVAGTWLNARRRRPRWPPGADKAYDSHADRDLLDKLQEQLERSRYTGRAIFRLSTSGRGIRLHETSDPTAVMDIRQAIRNGLQHMSPTAVDPPPLKSVNA